MTNDFQHLNLEIPEEEFISKYHQNAMELLVIEEIEKQMKDYPLELIHQINKIEVAAYALNRLPPLYASSEEGLYCQKQLGKKDFQEAISRLVAQSLAVIQQQPVRFYTPLITTEMHELHAAKAAMEELKEFLGFAAQEVSWLEIIKEIKHQMNDIANTEIDTQVDEA
ncbi:MAG: late competence development ComFB family protein [Gomphosphaeria aponina SAG 52.96 = DSM 107014]|uniref:Late competence development ComFB family protein n=1 Tax=Gomphosphaeria aponina SAG 52.96 = DSM 107014 TaxID=1521640 RepID=A0A941GV33_9CHRO|nr:late competence development ComFB family protein [Gomphosphaeria aponina SAG 52.96 = DSM 107014]